jgi:hypothetical protein
MEIWYFWAMVERDSPFLAMWVNSPHAEGVMIIERKKQRKENRHRKVPDDFNSVPLEQRMDCDFPKVEQL